MFGIHRNGTCYKFNQVIMGQFLPRNYREMTISFVKFHGKKIWEPQHNSAISNPCYNKVCYKSIGLYLMSK